MPFPFKIGEKRKIEGDVFRAGGTEGWRTETGTYKDAPVELEDAPIYFGFGFGGDAAERCVVQAIDVLGYEGADRAGVLQCGERVVCWVWKGATDEQESDVCTKPGKHHEMYSPSPYIRARYIPVSLPGGLHVKTVK